MEAKQKKLSIVIFIVLICIFFGTCKKDKIKGDFTPLIGKWRWVMKTGGITGQASYPINWNDRVIIFHKKGTYEIWHGTDRSNRGKLFMESDYLRFKRNSFGMEVGRDELTLMKFYSSNIRNDSLFLSESNPPPSDGYTDVYVRQ